MKKRYALLALALLAFTAHAQEFKQAIGIRGGLSSGLEYRYLLDERNALKLLLSARDRGFQLHGIFEFHERDLFPFTNRLVFVYGAGAHVGYQRWDELRESTPQAWNVTITRSIAGFDGLAGLEYTFFQVPFSVGIEVKPFVDFWGRDGIKVQPLDFAFTIKYLF